MRALKQIRLITTCITNTQAPEGFLLDYRNEFMRIVEYIAEGLTTSQMGAAIKVAIKLHNAQAGDVLILDDEEWEYLRARVGATKFSFAAPEIVAMVEAVERAETWEAAQIAQAAD